MTSSMFDGTEHSQIFVALALIAGIIGSFSSSTVIFLIYKMKIWNLHIAMILAMTVFELLYDISFFSGMANTGSVGISVTSNVAQLQGGTTSSIISNVIAGIALYVVYYKKTLDALKYYYVIIALAVVPGLVINILYIIAVSGLHHDNFASIAVLNIYYYIRLASIMLNFLCSYGTALLIHRMRSQSCAKSSSETAIRNLSMRLFYYPIVQALGRSGCAWYEGAYGYNFAPHRGFNFNPSSTSDTQFAAQCLMVVSTPFISVGYLAIFLIMQPNAARCLDESIGWGAFLSRYRVGSSTQDETDTVNNDELGTGAVTGARASAGAGGDSAVDDVHNSLHRGGSSMAELSHIGGPSEDSVTSFRDIESIMSSRMPSSDVLSEAGNVNLFDLSK